MMMAILSTHKLIGFGCDVKTAFLTADPTHNVYCELPKRWNGDTPNDKDEVARCMKSVYGCKDASRNFYRKVSTEMTSKGFTVSTVDQCLWIKGSLEKGNFVAAGWYVDDCSIICSNEKLKAEFLKDIQEAFEITIDPLTEMLGVKITVHDKR